ncbi:hypothetical protein K474DRAFT_409672 [Panus rudis PR-1116 ss-1]|nr:hypothetical protein K474DRAFT_409672 [Panus rudis PR-1116 ss-1]
MSSASEIQHQLDEAIANAKAHPLDDDAQQQVLDLLVAKLGDTDANAKLITEIQALGGYSLEIRTAMDHIDDIFRSIILENTSDVLKSDVQGLQNKWTEYTTKYTDLLWESRRVAGDAEAAANDFAGDFITFLSDESTSIATKKSEIAGYLTQLASDEPKAAAMSQGFSDLQLNITNFQQDWATVVKNHSLDDLNAQATQLQTDIDTLTTTLAGYGLVFHFI